jgi:ABC-type transport system involved in cytochrome c biogenesis permease subunit
MEAMFLVTSIALAASYLAISFFAGAFFYTGRRSFSITTDVLMLAVLPAHLAYLVALGITKQKVPFTSFFEALSAIAFFLTFLSSILHVALKIKAAAVFSFPLVFVCQLLSAAGSRIIFLNEGLFRSPLFGAHTLSTLLGYAAFACSMVMGLMYLHLFRELKQRKPRRMYDHAPPLELLALMNDAALGAGFLFLSLGILLGSILAVRVWGRVPFADPKILLSVALWVIYVVGILLRWVFRWTDRKLSYFSVSGFAVVVVFMAAVRLFLPTFHRF